jgi:Ser/Thr protein kinase RdoA (MazF antagonist)
MDEEAPGPLLASGRDADVYDLGDDTVLRRYRRPDGHDVELEARVIGYVAERGFPVPAVHRFDDRDLVMDRVDGPSMLDALQANPWKLLWYARRLARLQRKLARIVAPAWLLASTADPDRAASVLHLDLHPMNVLMSRRHGPVVIDWANAAGGPAGFDAAMSYVTMATFESESGRDRVAQKTFVEAFRRFRGASLIAPYVEAACDHRLADPNTTVEERVAVAELRTRRR